MKPALFFVSLMLFCSVSFAQNVTYSISSIPYQFESYYPGVYQQLAMDDTYGQVTPIGFTFNFFGIDYDSLIFSTNGTINFNTSKANTNCSWMIGGITLPSDSPNCKNSIMAPYQDLLFLSNLKVNFKMKGIAPYRRLVITYDSIPLFACSNLYTTTQIVLHETTHWIDVILKNKATCFSWNFGNSLLGIEDSSGLVAYAPPGRNGGSWSTSQESWRFIPSNAGPSNPNTCKISGNVYYDLNANCIVDSGENNLMNAYVYTDVGGYYGFCDVNGDYEMFTDTGTYVVSHVPSANATLVCPSATTYTVSFPSNNMVMSGLNFADSTASCLDLFSTIGTPSFDFCSVGNQIDVVYGNMGSLPSPNSTLSVTVPDATLTYDYSINPTSVTGNTLLFDLGNLLPGQTGVLSFKESVPCDSLLLNTTASFTSSIAGNGTDCNTLNNGDVLFTIISQNTTANKVTAEIQSNLPSGFVANGFVASDEWINFKVDFQNASSTIVQNIHVLATLDSLRLDMNSVELIGANFMPAVLTLNQNQIDIRLLEINLPSILIDSNKSKSWVMFKAKVKPNLQLNDQIITQATVIFDTSSQVTTSFCSLNVSPSGIEQITSPTSLSIIPNPTKSSSIIYLNHIAQGAVIRVMDARGTVVFEDHFSNAHYELASNKIKPGNYFVGIYEPNGKKYFAQWVVE